MDEVCDSPLFQESFQRELFDNLAHSYDHAEWMSLGLLCRWRAQAIDLLELQGGETVCDLMCGTGAAIPRLAARVGPGGRVAGIDSSVSMLVRAKRRLDGTEVVELYRSDARSTPLPDGSVDAILCAFGVKSLDPVALRECAAEMARILRPGGKFVIVEASRPCARWMRAATDFYRDRIVGNFAALFLPRGESHYMLSEYLTRGPSPRDLIKALACAGLAVEAIDRSKLGLSYFVRGAKPRD